MKAFKSLLLAVALLLTLALPAQAKDLSGSVVILHTNDVHGAIDGYAKVAALKDDYEAKGAYVLLVDAGDFSQGETAVSDSQGAAAVELMNLAGYDLAVPGNHEFDFGYENLKALEQQAEFPFVSANVLEMEVVAETSGLTISSGKSAFPGYQVFTSPDGTKIGVFGLTTPETSTKAHPAKIQGLQFESGHAIIGTARSMVRILENKSCDIIVCVGHMGVDKGSQGSRSIDVLESVEGIDVFIDGHSHATMAQTVTALNEADVKTAAALTSAGSKLESVGIVTLRPSAGGWTAERAAVTTSKLAKSDKAVADRAAAILAEIDEAYGMKIATTTVHLNGDVAPGNRTQETNLGDLVADALLWGTQTTDMPVDAAIFNGGGIRASMKTGDMTKNDVLTVLPFGNTANIVQVTGAALLEALEASTYCTPEPAGAFPQVSGIQMTVDTTKKFDAGAAYPGSTYRSPRSIQRVTIQSVGGRPFDAQDMYTIATNDFLAAGGDSYHAFKTAAVNYDLGLPVDALVMDYIAQELRGISEETYGAPAGRIFLKGAVPFVDVGADAAYYDAVEYVYENDILDGVTDTAFAPDATMTRGQMVTVLWQMEGAPKAESALPFADVTAASPHAEAIAWAYENDLAGGYTDTAFAPAQPISRQQFLTILHRYAQYRDYDVTVGENTNVLSYTDVAQVGEYAIPAMQWACGAQIVQSQDGLLLPTAAPSRSQVAIFLMNFCENVVPGA